MKIKISRLRLKEILIENLFLVVALSSLGILFLIMIFLFREGLPIFDKVSVAQFLGGTEWYPTSSNMRFGIFPLLASSIAVTFLA